MLYLEVSDERLKVLSCKAAQCKHCGKYFRFGRLRLSWRLFVKICRHKSYFHCTDSKSNLWHRNLFSSYFLEKVGCTKERLRKLTKWNICTKQTVWEEVFVQFFRENERLDVAMDCSFNSTACDFGIVCVVIFGQVGKNILITQQNWA